MHLRSQTMFLEPTERKHAQLNKTAERLQSVFTRDCPWQLHNKRFIRPCSLESWQWKAILQMQLGLFQRRGARQDYVCLHCKKMLGRGKIVGTADQPMTAHFLAVASSQLLAKRLIIDLSPEFVWCLLGDAADLRQKRVHATLHTIRLHVILLRLASHSQSVAKRSEVWPSYEPPYQHRLTNTATMLQQAPNCNYIANWNPCSIYTACEVRISNDLLLIHKCYALQKLTLLQTSLFW